METHDVFALGVAVMPALPDDTSMRVRDVPDDGVERLVVYCGRSNCEDVRRVVHSPALKTDPSVLANRPRQYTRVPTR